MSETLRPGPEGEQNQNQPENATDIWLEEPQIFEPAEPIRDEGESQKENSDDKVSTPLDKKPQYPWGHYNPFFVRG